MQFSKAIMQVSQVVMSMCSDALTAAFDKQQDVRIEGSRMFALRDGLVMRTSFKVEVCKPEDC